MKGRGGTHSTIVLRRRMGGVKVWLWVMGTAYSESFCLQIERSQVQIPVRTSLKIRALDK